MRKLSSKRIFMYFSLALIFCYCTFVLIAYNNGILKGLYDIKKSSSYYMVVYVLLSAVSYVIDTQTRKEPALLTLICFPIFTLVLLLILMLIASISTILIVVLICAMVSIIILGYIGYKKWIHKILLIKHGYENILFGYVIIHIFAALFVAFKIIGLL